MVDSVMSSKLEIFVSAKHLPSKDTFSKSDPFCVVSVHDTKSSSWRELGRTEVLKDQPNPEFKKSFQVEYFFEEQQDIKFDIYDADGTSSDLKAHDFIGGHQIPLATLVSAPGQSITDKLRKAAVVIGRAQINLRCEEITTSRDFINFTIAGENLDKMDTFGKSDGYLQFFRVREDNTWVQVHQTEVVMNTLNPRWRGFSLTLAQLCNGDHKRPLKIKCWDWDKNTKHDFIGECQTSVKELLETKAPVFQLTRPEHKKADKRTKSHGQIVFTQATLVKEYSFLDYISGGMQIGLIAAIDYTGSNGNPEESTSLHYRRGAGPNEYQQTISTIGQIVAQYDTDQKFPVFGFGGKVSGTVSHCFPLTFDPARPEVAGIDGILRAYHNSFTNVLLSGPTYFSEVIRTATTIASQPYSATLQHYTILLIITDGVINDMSETTSAIIDASAYPISIIIVGVGSANFEQMRALDGDEVKLEYKGKRCTRDIVQFVPVSQFRGQHISALAKETLAEVPAQVLSYMKSKGVLPMPSRRPALAPMATMIAASGAHTAAPAASPAGAGAPMEFKGPPMVATMPLAASPVYATGAPPPGYVLAAAPPPGMVLVAGGAGAPPPPVYASGPPPAGFGPPPAVYATGPPPPAEI